MVNLTSLGVACSRVFREIPNFVNAHRYNALYNRVPKGSGKHSSPVVYAVSRTAMTALKKAGRKYAEARLWDALDTNKRRVNNYDGNRLDAKETLR